MSLEPDPELTDRIARIRHRIAEASVRSGRAPDAVRLVAVSKRQPLERVVGAVLAGVRDLGENLVQEARDKREALLEAIGDAPPPRWHLIGNLQRNKAGLATRLFDRIETVDRARLADALARQAEAAGKRLPILLQVNTSGEATKSGIAPEQLPELLAVCHRHPALEVVGLMAIPKASEAPDASRPDFARLRTLRDTLQTEPGGASLHELSMGMSNDFEAAIEEGATSVRVGTALFGERATRPATGASRTEGARKP
jgi:hypothetical protein